MVSVVWTLMVGETVRGAMYKTSTMCYLLLHVFQKKKKKSTALLKTQFTPQISLTMTKC